MAATAMVGGRGGVDARGVTSRCWDWRRSGDQLGETPISPGRSTTLSNVSCDSAEIKVIGEDQNGCFLYQIVACGGDATWTITNNATPDCGN